MRNVDLILARVSPFVLFRALKFSYFRDYSFCSDLSGFGVSDLRF